MPRPDFRKPGATGKGRSSNPITSWLEARKERHRMAEEEAARLITDKLAENENTIIDKLSSIDFFNSKLPKSILEEKTDKNQSCCNLEYTTKSLIAELRNNTQVIKMDIRKIDQNLLTLVLLFKQSVEQGDVRAAYAAKAGIYRGIADIRSRIPQEQPELATAFVEANAQYLDQWITLVKAAQVADRTKQNADNHRKRLEQSQKQHDENVQELKNRLLKEPEFLVVYKDFMDKAVNTDRSKWTQVHYEVHRILVDRRVEKNVFEVNSFRLQQVETELATQIGMVENLNTKLAELPIVVDPNLMSKYKEAIDDMFVLMAETDTRIDESLKSMDDISGRIAAMGIGPGATRALEVAAEEAEDLLQELHLNQEDHSGETNRRAKQILDEINLLTEEQLAEQKKQTELEIEQEQIEEQVEEQQMLIN